MNFSNKFIIMKPAYSLVITLFVIFGVFIIYNSRKTLNYVYNYSQLYSKENNNRVKDLENYVYEKDLLNDSNISTRIRFFWKSQIRTNIIRLTKNGRYDSFEATPDFLKNFFSGNKLNTLLITKDGIKFLNIYSTWSWKNCTLKYFYKEHGLKKNMIYESKYLVTDFIKNDIDEFCCVLDEHWVLLVLNDKR